MSRVGRRRHGLLDAPGVDGFVTFLTFVDEGRDLGSWLIVVPAAENVVKVRATYGSGRSKGAPGDAEWSLLQ
jgi:hypothetical protein